MFKWLSKFKIHHTLSGYPNFRLYEEYMSDGSTRYKVVCYDTYSDDEKCFTEYEEAYQYLQECITNVNSTTSKPTVIYSKEMVVWPRPIERAY